MKFAIRWRPFSRANALLEDLHEPAPCQLTTMVRQNAHRCAVNPQRVA
jgi:hypothetical protein